MRTAILLGAALSVLLCASCSTTTPQTQPAIEKVHWLTIPAQWVPPNTNYWADVDVGFVAGNRYDDNTIKSKVQMGFRSDGVVVWRKINGGGE